MTSPRAILTAAADLIRDTAQAATPGPWFTHDTHLNQGGHTATVLSGTYPEGQLRAWLPTWSHEPWDEARNVWNDARWVALMSPAVAPWLSSILGWAAKVCADAEADGWDRARIWAESDDLMRAAIDLAEHVIAALGKEGVEDG